MFVHFILDPISISETATEASFAARYGCLVLIENVERLDVGALVSIRGAGRVKISRFLGADPYLSGEVRPIQDRMNYESSNELTSKISQLKESIKNLNSLEIKLKAPADSPLQTRLINSLNWAEDEPPVDFDESFVPSLQERLSFSAFQPISGNFTYFHYRVFMFQEDFQVSAIRFYITVHKSILFLWKCADFCESERVNSEK